MPFEPIGIQPGTSSGTGPPTTSWSAPMTFGRPLRVFRIPVLAGRALTNADDASAPAVAVVSETMARRFWPNEDPVGRRIQLGPPGGRGPWLTIVGVVGDVKQNWFDPRPRKTKNAGADRRLPSGARQA